MRTLALLSLCTLAGMQDAGAQSVSGIIRDDKGRPVAQATISLLSAADSTWLRSEVSDAAGQYTLSYEAGDYLLQAVAEAQEPQVQKCALSREIPATLDFTLKAKAVGLNSVTVTAKKSFIEARPGMMVVNVEGSAVSTGSDALDLLRRSPGVQVSPQGAITMRGKSDVQVYIDGRPSRLSGDQLVAYLKSMTAEEIAQLELITQPSAKYDAAGTAGIINIRTRAVRKRGLNGTLSGTATHATESYGNLSGRITYRYNKLTLYASEYFNYVDNHNQLQVNRRFLDDKGTSGTGSTFTDQEIRYNSRFHRVKVGGEYAFTPNTTIGVRAQMPIGNPEMGYTSFTTVNDLPTATTTYMLGQRSMSNHWQEKEVGLLGRHRFKQGDELSFDGFYCANEGGDHGLFLNTPTDRQGNATGSPDTWQLSFPVQIRYTSLQADYTRSLGKQTKLETGVKYVHVRVDNTADYRIPDNNGQMIPDTLRSTRFIYKETVPAAYASISHTFNAKLDAQVGLRAEQTTGKGEVPKTNESFNRNYLSLFPTVFASYKIDSVHTATLSYGRRLDRPGYYLLNPSRDYIDKYSYRVGNPRLMPQFINKIELGYTYKGQLTATLSFMQADGIISDFFVQDDQTKTAYEVHDNIAGYRQAGLSINYNKAIRPWWTVNLYGDGYFSEYKGNYYGTDYTRQGSTWSFNANNQYNLGHGWGGELSGWFNGPGQDGVFSRANAMGSLDVAVSKKMLSDSLIIKLSVNDVFGTQQYRGQSRFANFDTDVYSIWDARRAALSLTYNFGSSIELMQRKNDAEQRRM